MKLSLVFLNLYYTTCVWAQSSSPSATLPPLDTAVFDQWPSVQGPAITANGNYVLYTISNQPVYSRTLVVRSVLGHWKKELPGAGMPAFTASNRQLIYLQGKDSLCQLRLGTDHTTYITPVSTFRLFKQRKNEWMAYQLSTPQKQLVLRNINTGKEQVFAGVTGYLLSQDGAVLVFTKEAGEGSESVQTLNRACFSRDSCSAPQVIWKGREATALTLNAAGTQLAFIVENSIWYYSAGATAARQLADEQSQGIDSGLQIVTLSNFSLDGERLLFTLQEKVYPRPAPPVKVDIWSYRDARPQSQQLIQEVAAPRSYTAVINIKDQHIIRLQQPGEELWPVSNNKNDDWALITYRKGDPSEESWNPLSQPLYYLVSLKTGQRKPVDIPFAGISPAGKYLIGDDGQGNFYSYELATGITSDITKAMPVPKGDAGYDKPALLYHRGIGSGGHWLPHDAAMLMYDRYDCWWVDPRGIKAPVNLTNGYGRRNHITFRLTTPEGTVSKMHDRLILDAFDNNNKQNGFYNMVLGKVQHPIPLTMGPYLYYAREYFYLEGEPPLRARDAACYIVRRCSAGESGNYYFTRNFKHFTPLSHVYPERQYNWLQSELVEFTTLNEGKVQGILYKPLSFDPGKKYPVLIHYYETMSERLNQYIPPGFSAGDINIPYFVSRGYLVFTPDIHYTIGATGQSACNTIAAAAAYLAHLPWVDTCRMGITGRSFGGFITNYIITHSNRFAAACADAGAVNLVSGWGTYELNTGVPLQELYEHTYYRMGATPWQRPDLYIKNSPIFMADKVTTPVLLVSNKLDAVVHFAQGVELFTALRRLGKKAWMLQYEGEGHNLLQRSNQLDLTIRITQFFDHYLQGAPAPEWMTRSTGY